MVLETERRLLDPIVLPLARLLRHVNPNFITLLGLLVAVPAAYFFWKSSPETEATDYYLIFAGLLTFLHGILDLLDGFIARTYGKATRLGDFLDHVVDRVADVLLLSALSFSPWGNRTVGLFAIVATLLTSYLGTQAQAVGAGRMYTGFVARADRLVLLIVVPFVDHFLVVSGTTLSAIPGTPYALGLVLWYIAIGGGLTALERFLRTYRYLRRHPT